MKKQIAKNSERGKHPNSLKAIEQHQFKKGESGNIGGRPKKHEKLTKSLSLLRDKVITEYRTQLDIMLEDDNVEVGQAEVFHEPTGTFSSSLSNTRTLSQLNYFLVNHLHHDLRYF